jgi:hypothetical protein
LRAVSFSICWLSDNPNCMVVSSRRSTTPSKHRGTEEARGKKLPKRRNFQRLRNLKAFYS